MISLHDLDDLVGRYGSSLDLPVRPSGIASAAGTSAPLIMGVVNLSRDSTYRASIAATFPAAVRRGTILAAQGCDVIDVGAESSTARARVVEESEQVAALVPVVRALAGQGLTVSVECHDPAVARAGLEAGATVVNYTGRRQDDEVFDLVAEHGATVILCYVPGDTVRQIADAPVSEDPIPHLLDHFGERVARATERGVNGLVIDPGLGFYYGNLVDPLTRLRYQTRLILQSFRLRGLGFPVCQALPHALELFESDYRQAESFFAVLAHLAQVDIVRTHEVAPVAAVLRSMRELDAGAPG